MNYPVRVRLGQPFAGLNCVFGRACNIERAVDLECSCEAATLEILHNHVRYAFVSDAGIEHVGHVFASQLRDRLCFARESRQGVPLVGHDLSPEKLQSYALLEMKMRCRDDEPHPAFGQRSFHAIFAGHHRAGPQNQLRVLAIYLHRLTRPFSVRDRHFATGRFL